MGLIVPLRHQSRRPSVDPSSDEADHRETTSDGEEGAPAAAPLECWFCGTRPAVEAEAYKAKMSSQRELGVEDMGWSVRRFVQGSGLGLGPQTVERWRVITLAIPRCATCREAHMRSKALRIIGFILGFAVGLLLMGGSRGFWVPLGSMVGCGLLGLVAGHLLGARLRPEGCRPTSYWEQHPAALELAKAGFVAGGSGSPR
jgi:hypothetical protein